MGRRPEIIAALDMNTLEEMRHFLARLGDSVAMFKVGSQLFTSCGPAAVRFLEARGRKVFLDLKYHDIPHTVARAVEAAVRLNVAEGGPTDFAHRHPPRRRGLSMLTVHAAGGIEMMRAAVTAARETAGGLGVDPPAVVAVTVLTSALRTDETSALVLRRAEEAHRAGCDGVVASVKETALLRKHFGDTWALVTPGIRPEGADLGDQRRVATPAEAARRGSDYLVIGRPILTSPDPRSAVERIRRSLG